MQIRMKLKDKIKVIISAIFGIFSAYLGVLGALGICPCWFPIIAAFLSVIGVSSVILTKYNIIFLFLAIIFLSLSVFLFLKSIGERKNFKSSLIKNKNNRNIKKSKYRKRKM
jgi:hypothetical protein